MVNHLVTRLISTGIATSRSLSLGLMLLLSACSEPLPPVVPADLDVAKLSVSLTALATLQLERQQQLMLDAASLRLSIDEFLQEPDAQRQQAAQTAWRSAHLAFLDLAALPLAGPLREPLAPLLYQIDAWPIEPGYLDQLPAYPDSGLISDLTVPITPESLREQNGFTDSSEVSLGFHALEYLIFDRDATDFRIPGPASPRIEPTADAQINVNANEIIVRRRLVLDVIMLQITVDLDLWLTDAKRPNAPEDLMLPTGEIARLLAHSLQTAQLAITEVNRLLIPGEGHGVYSQSSRPALCSKVSGLKQIFFAPVRLGDVLSPLAADATQNLQKSLQAATDLCALTEISELETSRLELLLLALPNQIEALSAALTKAMADAQNQS